LGETGADLYLLQKSDVTGAAHATLDAPMLAGIALRWRSRGSAPSRESLQQQQELPLRTWRAR